MWAVSEYVRDNKGNRLWNSSDRFNDNSTTEVSKNLYNSEFFDFPFAFNFGLVGIVTGDRSGHTGHELLIISCLLSYFHMNVI